MKKIALAVGLAVAGLLTAVAVAAGTGSSVSCATTTAQSHTVGVDGSPVSTVGGDVLSVCATATDQTVTVTTTVAGTTTAPTTTTQPTTTSAPPDETYDQAIAYSQNLPAFTPVRTVNVSTSAQLQSAISGLKAGDLVKASAPFTSSPLTISNKLSSPAELDLTGVTIAFTGSSDTEAVELNNPSNLLIKGGTLTTGATGGMCLRIFGSQHITWYGFNLHTCGDTGLQAIADGSTAAMTNDDLQGEISNVALDRSYDPHPEKGTGIHGANLWDSGSSLSFSNNRFALYVHDVPSGACVEYGNGSGAATGDTLYLDCQNETEVSQTQTGGNGIQFWGGAMPSATLDIPYIECGNLQGSCVYSIVKAPGVQVEYGRASNTNQNPQVTPRQPWNTSDGIVYQDVQPVP